ncbi:hypothetical protein LOTGIDRAFT_230633 [Lottia gigantea]|uniref:ShKT domain-containing protein n=1 Tax=Lottia gigantea TaxID=225164 RepID=V4B1R4_LOTGI|nr:hypothetical protein LOTGIDRAFT_230633 [Lottia gigantea]ESP01266.1 hypothetical protein LOTGIDRAFT_230633 [Lottia gigantea]
MPGIPLSVRQIIRTLAKITTYLYRLIKTFTKAKTCQCTPTTESRVVSKIKVLTGNCVDSSGTIVPDGGSWTSSAGVCDKNICYHAPFGIYTIQERCRPLGPTENPDNLNCQTVSETIQPFPSCCPKLECDERNPLTTMSPSACIDMATPFSCEFWKNETSGCQSGINEVLYNYAKDYCQKTCGLC